MQSHTVIVGVIVIIARHCRVVQIQAVPALLAQSLLAQSNVSAFIVPSSENCTFVGAAMYYNGGHTSASGADRSVKYHQFKLCSENVPGTVLSLKLKMRISFK